MRNFLLTLAAATLLTGTAFAHTITVDTVGPKDSGGEYVGPYGGLFDGIATNVYCDDVNHNITIGAAATNVNVSTINDLSLTRFGGSGAATALTAVASYEQIFYLSAFLSGTYAAPATFYGTFVGGTNSANTSVTADIQDAMWTFFSGTPLAPNAGTNQVNYWLNQAAANYARYTYGSFRILTDSTPGNQYNGVQELFVNTRTGGGLTPTPEPASIALIASGIGLLGWRARRRQPVR